MSIARPITALVIHCSASPDAKWLDIREIDRWHAARGFKRDPAWVKKHNPHLPHIGYHRVIDVNGESAFGRHYEEIGAHVQGSNAKSIGICMVGTSRFTSQAWLGLKWTVIAILRELAISRLPGRHIDTADDVVACAKEMGITICGHRDYSPDQDGDGVVEPWEWLKTCPGFSVADWLKRGMVRMPGHEA